MNKKKLLRAKIQLGLEDSKPKFSRGATLTLQIKGFVHVFLLSFIRTSYSHYIISLTLSLNLFSTVS